jgi:hypothetical protein
MPRTLDPKRRIRSACRTAKISTLLFGLALLAYATAPIVAFRYSTGDAPPTQMLVTAGVTLAVGLFLILLSFPVGRGMPWSLWATKIISAALLVGTIAVTYFYGARATAIFPALLAVSSGATCALALEARRAGERLARLTRPVR